MHGARRLSPAGRLLVAAVVAMAALAGSGSTADSAAAAGLPHWTGGIDLYRTGVFTTQKTWLWCTAADVQIVRNIVDHAADHTRSGQQRYFDVMRAHNRYNIPVSDGVDPAGWTYGLRHYVDARYRLVASGSFSAALRSAVTSLRRTNLPVGITVAHGNHAWILTGFSATADPAVTTRFSVTSVRVVGPLWGLQSRSYGYDMRPDTKLTPKQLAGFFTPWHYARIRMAWEGSWVSIQPTGTASTTSAPTSILTPIRMSPPKPSATAGPSVPVDPAASAGPPGETPGAASTPGAVAFAGGPPHSAAPAILDAAGGRLPTVSEPVWLVVALAVACAAASIAVVAIRSPTGRGTRASPPRGVARR